MHNPVYRSGEHWTEGLPLSAMNYRGKEWYYPSHIELFPPPTKYDYTVINIPLLTPTADQFEAKFLFTAPGTDE